MDLNVKLMEEHLLAYQNKSHVWEGFCSGLLPLMGQAKMNSFQTDKCVDSLLPISMSVSQKRKQEELAPAYGLFVF